MFRVAGGRSLAKKRLKVARRWAFQCMITFPHMKRCPLCKFIYLDSDELCDLDGTPLVHVDNAEIEAAAAVDDGTKPVVAQPRDIPAQATRGNRTILTVAAIAGLVLGVVLFLVYYVMTRARP